MIRTLFLDADDTLLDFRRAEHDALREALQCFGISPTEQLLSRYHEINASYWKRLEQKQITREALTICRFADLLREFGYDIPAERLAYCYEEALSHHGPLIDGAKELLEVLRGKYRLCITSNGSRSVQLGRLRASGLLPLLDNVFLSQDLGFDKPDPRFFAACFASLPDASPDTTLILGDSLTSDILGGRNAGIRTVWFCPGKEIPQGEIRPDFTISRLLQLLELLKTAG